MPLRTVLFALPFVTLAAAASAEPVLMISLDGLRPADVIEAKKKGLNLPNLTAFMKVSAYATGVRNVLPTVTYPDHTTLITGVWPDKHGIGNNETFDPTGKNLQGWYWYAEDIKVPTLWDAVHDKKGVVGAVGWPVSVGSLSIDYNVPEYWRAQNAEDLKLLRALATPGLIGTLEKETKLPLGALFGEEPQNDVGRTAYAIQIIADTKPQFMTVHLVSLDHYQHTYGPDTEQSKKALEGLDKDVGDLIAAAKKADPTVTVAIVSDHGFAAVHAGVYLNQALTEAGLITLDDKGKLKSWDAISWNAGGSAAIVLAHPDDEALKAKVAAVLNKLAADPNSGVARWIDKTGIAARGGSPQASFWVDFKIGYSGSGSFTIAKTFTLKGTHGYFPDNKEMRATFMIAGPGIKPKKLGEIDMRDIAPTLAKILDVPLPKADGKPLF
jgi:predicted AlkP superfamily pyrophosphatase or phosphodiesterase